MKKVMVWALGAMALGLIGCGEDAAGTDEKGVEEQAIDDLGKADSFFKPTEHGQVNFNLANQAALVDEALFHAWEFTLSEGAQVVLTTQTSGNLDTVMYLYRRDPGQSSWGRFHKKNDDHDGKLSSQIKLDGDAAEYRVVVKGHKKAMRGPFTLEAQCDGAGCPDPNAGGTCDAEVFADFPGSVAGACGAEVHAVFNQPISFQSGNTVPVSERCSLGPLGALGVEYYIAYWDGIFGFSDFVGDEEDPLMNVEVSSYGDKGTVVGVDIGADEDFVAFVFNAQDELVMLFHDEQSPTLEFFCDDAQTDKVDEDCAARTIYNMARRADQEKLSEGQTSGATAADDLDELMAFGVATFVTELGLGDNDAIDFQAARWEDRFDGDGARLTLGANGTTITYTMANDFGTAVILFVEEGAGVTYVCQSQE